MLSSKPVAPDIVAEVLNTGLTQYRLDPPPPDASKGNPWEVEYTPLPVPCGSDVKTLHGPPEHVPVTPGGKEMFILEPSRAAEIRKSPIGTLDVPDKERVIGLF